MNDPRLSICILTYNRANYLERCISAITAQEEFHSSKVEVIIGDDASKDNTKIIMDNLLKKSSKLRYLRNAVNVGFEKNILNLMTNATGDYVFFITDDDFMLPNSLGAFLKTIDENSDCGLFSSSYEICPERQSNTLIHHTLTETKKIKNEDIENVVKIFNDSHVLSRMCIKRELIDFDGYKRHIGSMYPHMFIIGVALLKSKSYYSSNPLIQHTTQNKVDWEYTNDYMIGGQIEIAKDLSIISRDFYNKSLENILADIPILAAHSLSRNPAKLFAFMFELTKIKETRLNYKMWSNIFQAVTKKIAKHIAKS